MNMKMRSPEIPDAEMKMGQMVVVMHCDEGLAATMSLEVAKEMGEKPHPLGIAAEAAYRPEFSDRLLVQTLEEWMDLWGPSENVKKMISCLTSS